MKRPLLMTVLGLAMILSGRSDAAIVQTTLTLDAASSTANRLALGLLDGTATTDLSGTIIANIDIDLATGVIASIELDGGDMNGTAWNMNVSGVGTLMSTASTATSDTTNPPVNVTGTAFDATMTFIALTSGQVTGPGAPVPLAGTNLEGAGNGTLTSALNGGNCDIFFSMMINDTEPLAGTNLAIAGTVVARGSISAVPEPSSAISSCSAGRLGHLQSTAICCRPPEP